MFPHIAGARHSGYVQFGSRDPFTICRKMFYRNYFINAIISHFLKRGIYVTPIFIIGKISSLAAANFCLCRSFDSGPEYIYLLLLKILRIFPLRVKAARHQTLSVKLIHGIEKSA
jgi:hypothetical protein